jgi:hypothetical protein
VPRAHDVGRCGFYLKVDRAVVSLLSKADWSWGCVAAIGSDGRTFTTFDVPGAVLGTVPTAINPAGTITGYYVDASFVSHGFIRIP